MYFAFSVLTLTLGQQEGHMACKSLFLLSPVVGSLSGDQAQPEITLEKEIRYSETESSTGGVSCSTTLVVLPFFWDHPGEPVPEEDFWTDLLCKGRLTETVTLTIQLGATPAGLTSAHLHHPPIFLQAACPFCHHPTNSIKALKATTVVHSD